MTPAEKVELVLRRRWAVDGYSTERVLDAARVVMDNAEAINAIFAPTDETVTAPQKNTSANLS